MTVATKLLDPGELPTFLVPDELAGLMRTTTGALAQDRYLGRGVPFIKNRKRILYARADVVEFIERSRRGAEGIDDTGSIVIEGRNRRNAKVAEKARTARPKPRSCADADGANPAGGAQ